MTTAATELLATGNADLPTQGILQLIAVLDFLGARECNLRVVGLYTCAFLGVIRMIFRKKGNVDWWAFLHHFVTGVGSVFAIYLDFFSAEALTGTPEPLRSCLCGGPLTSLHRILPAITMGYGVLDLIEGLNLGLDFAVHGVMTFAVMTYFCEQNLPHIVVPFLLMEVSSIFLCFCKANFLSKTVSIVVQLLFALTFFIFRIVVSPYIWFRLMVTMYQHTGEELYQSCINPSVFPVSLVMGILFHCLNIFWFYKIVRKVRRIMSGEKKKKPTTKRRTRRSARIAAQEEDKENISAQSNTNMRRRRQTKGNLNDTSGSK